MYRKLKLLWGVFVLVFALLSGCSKPNNSKLSTNIVKCEVGNNIDAQIRMRLFDLGARAIRALYLKNYIQIAMMKRLAENDTNNLKKIADEIMNFWPPNITVESGKLAFVLFFKKAPVGWHPCKVGNSRILEVNVSTSVKEKSFGVIGYTFANKTEGFLIVLTAYYDSGSFVLDRVVLQEVKAGGRTAADLTADAEIAESYGDKLFAKLLYNYAYLLEPYNAIVRSQAAVEMKRKAELIQAKLPTPDTPLIINSWRVWSISIATMKEKMFLQVVFEFSDLTQKSVSAVAKELKAKILEQHKLLPKVFDAILFVARPVPPPQVSEVFRYVEPL